MSKAEFLAGLEAALLENMDISEAGTHIRYYREYIESEVAKGRSEEEIVAALQSPRLIAKSIVDNNVSANKYDNNVGENYTRSNSYQDQGNYGENYGSRKMSFSINGKPVNSMFSKVIIGIIAILFVAIIIFIVLGVVTILFKVVLPIFAIILMVSFIVKMFKGNS